ncbi:hypothetical protein SADUNF_Sadunf19G0054300 [Salix dunnii]|uniref:Uncharacterized protein n=1 Tax=Salix dunnii TaxID=1413687 RepID=A0A835J1G8_9ROSI|nr:hypothetical protein SADUNF_Sadunf19G0054300 [Salix dunnii]
MLRLHFISYVISLSVIITHTYIALVSLGLLSNVQSVSSLVYHLCSVKLCLSIPYEVGYSTLDRYTVGSRMDKEIRNRISVVLKHCLGADD